MSVSDYIKQSTVCSDELATMNLCSFVKMNQHFGTLAILVLVHGEFCSPVKLTHTLQYKQTQWN